MKLVLVLTAEAVAPMVKEEVVASAIIEVADLAEEDKEDTKSVELRAILGMHATLNIKAIRLGQGLRGEAGRPETGVSLPCRVCGASGSG